MFGYLIQILIMPLPWTLRRRVLCRIWGYRIDPAARIGYSVVRPVDLEIGPSALIGHLNFIRGMSSLKMGPRSSIGNLNWIYGIPAHLSGQKEHDSVLELAEGAQLTHRHLVDCTERITLGRFSVVAGYRSQLLTHSVDIRKGLQEAHPISIGAFSFVGTGCVILGDSQLPDCSVLGAGSVLRTQFEETHRVYAGTPASPTGTLPEDAAFFSRVDPRVDFESGPTA